MHGLLIFFFFFFLFINNILFYFFFFFFVFFLVITLKLLGWSEMTPHVSLTLADRYTVYFSIIEFNR